MKIQLISDLHTEFWKGKDFWNDILRPADVLVVAGDLAVGRTNVREVLKKLSKQYAHVIYTPGNHEYYSGLKLDDFSQEQNFDNVTYLTPGIVKIEDVTFFGGTLWTNFRENPLVEMDSQQFIADFKRIKDATPYQMKQRFYRDSAYIKHCYEQNKGKKVIVTHFMPAKELVAGKWHNIDHITSNLNGYFANDLGNWIDSLDDTMWLFGHTHDRVDSVIGRTRCVAAPFGYPGEHSYQYEPCLLEV